VWVLFTQKYLYSNRKLKFKIMPSKLDKLEGVFIITCEHEESKSGDDLGMAYVGKSKSIGAAIRSAKSKLRKGKFHNKSVQEDFDKYGIYDKENNPNGVFFEEPLIVKDSEVLGDVFLRAKDELIDSGYLLYQDVEFIKVKPETEFVDLLKERLSGDDYDVVCGIMKMLERGEVTSQQIRDVFSSQNKYI